MMRNRGVSQGASPNKVTIDGEEDEIDCPVQDWVEKERSKRLNASINWVHISQRNPIAMA
ncbi:hypothetical protein JCM17795_10750 [Galenea microaerophila]